MGWAPPTCSSLACDNLRIDVIIDCDIVIMKPKERVNSRGGVLDWVFSGGVLSKTPIHFGIHGVLVAIELLAS